MTEKKEEVKIWPYMGIDTDTYPLSVASTSIGLGMVAIGTYHQDKMDRLVNVEGQDEFVVYIVPVGRIN